LTSSPSKKTCLPSLNDRRYSLPVRMMPYF
jgi:hypothetical protein